MLPPDVLARVPGGEMHDPARLVRLAGGRFNETWHVVTPAGSFVVRRSITSQAVLGVDRAREHALHCAAAAAGLAPAVVHVDDAAGVLVTEFVAGGAWSGVDLEDSGHLERLGRCLARLHALEPPAVPPLDLAAIASRVRTLLHRGPAAVRERADALYEQASASLREIAASDPAPRPCIVHNDLNPANLVGPEPVLVDWEYAGLGDPVLDVASVLSFRPLSPDRTGLLLDAAGLGDPASRRRLAAWNAFCPALNDLWYLAEAELAGPPPNGGSVRSTTGAARGESAH